MNGPAHLSVYHPHNTHTRTYIIVMPHHLSAEERIALVRSIELPDGVHDIFHGIAADKDSAAVAEGSAVSFVAGLEGQMKASPYLPLQTSIQLTLSCNSTTFSTPRSSLSLLPIRSMTARRMRVNGTSTTSTFSRTSAGRCRASSKRIQYGIASQHDYS